MRPPMGTPLVSCDHIGMSTATVQTVPGAGLERAGAQALAVFARGLNAQVLRAHSDGPLRSAELEARLGWAAEASLRAATVDLSDLGALERTGRQPIATTLTPGGRALLDLADTLELWLSYSPFGALDLDGAGARGTVKALVAGWESTIVQALAQRPRRLACLSREVSGHSYPALKRRFSKLRTAALVECLDSGVRSPEYEATDQLRRAAAPLTLAIRWDREYAPASVRLAERDLGAVLLLALPLISLPPISGSCLLATARPQPVTGGSSAPPAVSLVVEKGKVVEAALAAAAISETWALASAEAWLDAVIDGQLAGVRMRGPDIRLAEAVVSGLHCTLFPEL